MDVRHEIVVHVDVETIRTDFCFTVYLFMHQLSPDRQRGHVHELKPLVNKLSTSVLLYNP